MTSYHALMVGVALRSGAMLKRFCADAVNQSLPAEDESHAYYVSALITRMLEHGHQFQVRRPAHDSAPTASEDIPSFPRPDESWY